MTGSCERCGGGAHSVVPAPVGPVDADRAADVYEDLEPEGETVRLCDGCQVMLEEVLEQR